MSRQLITYGTDRRLAIANAEVMRQPIWYSSWNRVRIGLHFNIAKQGSTANISGTPGLSFGLCSGTNNVWISGTSDHVIGVRNVNATWTHALSPAVHFASGVNNAYRGFKRIGTTVTDASAAFANNLCCWPEAATNVRHCMFLEIAKGSPNYGMKFWTNTANASTTDVGDAAFEEAMAVDDFASITGVGLGTIDATAKTLAVDEATNGAFTHIFAFWERTTQLFTFNIRHRKMA